MYFVPKKLLFFFLLTILTLQGCMLGPEFHSPPPPIVASYNASPLPAKTTPTPSAGKGGKSQRLVHDLDIPAHWWRLFHSKEINKMVELGIRNSPTIAAAEAALRQAQEVMFAQIGNSLFPAITGQAGVTRQRVSGGSLGGGSGGSGGGTAAGVSGTGAGAAAAAGGGGGGANIFNVYNISFNLSYNLDVFGGLRRQIEALAAQVDYQEFQLLAAYITLTTNIVTSAITTASLEQQIDATLQLIRFQRRQLTVLRNQLRLGAIAQTEVLSQETLLAQSEASLPALENNLAQVRHSLAVLMGVFPNQPIFKINLDKLNLPRNIPISFPSDLVRQRPDVRASEALLHAAMAQIGVATANLFPQFPITAAYGFASTSTGSLFSSASNFWSMGASITQPIFNGGALLAQRRAAIAAYVQAEAQYRQTVLQAFQNVADALRAIETDSRVLKAEKLAETASRQSMLLAQRQYELGGASYVVLVIAQQQYQRAVIVRIRAQATRYTDTAALFQALGGGWWKLPCTPTLLPG